MILLVVVAFIGSVVAQTGSVSQDESSESVELTQLEAEIREVFAPDFANRLIIHITKKPSPAAYGSCADVLEECKVDVEMGRIPLNQAEFMECHPRNDQLHTMVNSFHTLTAKLDDKYETAPDLCVMSSDASYNVLKNKLYNLDESRCINHFKQSMDYGGKVKSPMICVLTNKIYKNNLEATYSEKRIKCREIIKKINSIPKG